MKTAPIVPARIDWSGSVPRAPDFDDLYHPQAGAAAQAGHVFLRGNGLPGRWQGRERFVVLETGFGLGHNFLATWRAWRDDPARCTRLVHVAVEKHPPRADDLARAHGDDPLALELRRAWPPATPNLHRLAFEQGRLVLLLALGDVAALLPQLRLAADAFFLDGFAPDRNPAMWAPQVLKTLGRLAAPGATAATWSVARGLRDGLAAAGFEVGRAPGIGGKREISIARFAPRWGRAEGLAVEPAARTAPSIGPAAPDTRSARPSDATVAAPRSGSPTALRRAAVVGAGIAGAAVARALADEGFAVTVLERQAEPARDASGNPAGLVHGGLTAEDGPHARLLRAAALAAGAAYGPAFDAGTLGGALEGLLWLDGPEPGESAAAAFARLQARLVATGLPPDYVRLLDADAAAAAAGLPLAVPAWLYPGGGWIVPGDAVRHLLAGLDLRCGCTVTALERAGSLWRLHDAAGGSVEAEVVVLANAADAARLLAPLGHPPWPLGVSRGQVDVLGVAPATLRLPMTGNGYVLPLPGGRWLFGATRHPGDVGTDWRATDRHWNIDRLRRLANLPLPDWGDADAAVGADHAADAHSEGSAGSAGSADPPGSPKALGRAALRVHTPDRLPIAGAVPRPTAAQATGADRCVAGGTARAPRVTQVARLEREPGLFALVALGARGLTWAPLLGRLVAAQAAGSPWPLERDLAEAVDPGRWVVRAARRGS
jgi:tRNA 5-methylaminomethyl-2-thiouridine biosynthesis bifunctional protein